MGRTKIVSCCGFCTKWKAKLEWRNIEEKLRECEQTSINTQAGKNRAGVSSSGFEFTVLAKASLVPSALFKLFLSCQLSKLCQELL